MPKFPFQHSCGIVTDVWWVLSWNFAECQVYVCLFKIQTCWGSVLYVYENFGQKISFDCCYLTSGSLYQVHVYRYAPHDDVSVYDGPHIRQWSHKIMLL